MTAFGIFTLYFFIFWIIIFSKKTFMTYRAGNFSNPAVRDLWPMTLGVGLGILLYNYEVEYFLQEQLTFLPFSMSSLRAFSGFILIIYHYYKAIDKYTQFTISRWIRVLPIVCAVLIITVDILFHDQIPYEEFQVWMSLIIIPPIVISSLLIRNITKRILKEEVAPLNRAHYYWWVLELIAGSLSAIIFFVDAIYRIVTSTFGNYNFAVYLGCFLYFILALASQARIVLPPKYTRYIFYAERVYIYIRLQIILFLIERKITIPKTYFYERFWLPSYERLDLEISRSFIAIMDTVNYLHDVDPDLHSQFNLIRTSKKSLYETIDKILKVKFS